MIYAREKDGIRITDKSDFNIEHILECGQVFCYDKVGDDYIVFPADKFAQIVDEGDSYKIYTKDVDYFINWFDLDGDYSKIKSELAKHEILSKPIKFGYGIRILKQDLFETLISFIVSANNNIKRIKLILNNLRKNLGKKQEYGYSFPTFQALQKCDEDFFKKMGTGYRAGYLYKVLREITPEMLSAFASLPTDKLRASLIALSGVGPKVTDCVMLFGYNRFDVFPVDTWIVKMYNMFYAPQDKREQIAKNLVDEFGELSGYAQQYLFYYQRSFIKK